MSHALILDSLQRRLSALHSLYYEAVATMTLDQVNFVEREPVLPIAFSLFHQAQLEDTALVMLGGPGPIWNDEWSERLDLAINDHGKHKTVDEMVKQRIGNYDAFKEYQSAVFRSTENWLADLPESELTRVVIPRPFPPQIAQTFSARVAGEDGVCVLDGIECWIYQHGLRHMGEIEHARALVGLEGMTS
ncbi:MAG: hypothetical protein F2903_03940 [Actinobacteria bacterium]|uniref:Unannotated protein n=1 Tax=freshwater metagenome TaxID=449393 RepID=A0A6J6ZG67_9ZZZZ|nr:hypothetical protein [Actinomycetota bacterium]MSX09812.1 hypothetical protein [Actinomycetota bacterium]MSX67537.1 hypothetical protein [Actinomycetota bacterium]